ncbi:unnamed protein product [Gongylonema pulchrum]|uniref:Neur_chan_LBD domain-containing protein n=1 Tax=Gongylonema pulchrum TaxID=637853 RepID=A0A183ESU0_9BILA|nr:unnamed protein product [Gongylonema pulchrum]
MVAVNSITPFQVFVELYDLDLQKGGEWMETARWIKYEEVYLKILNTKRTESLSF